MNASADPPTERAVPNGGSIPRSWPWQVWSAVCVTFFFALAAHLVFRAPLSLSPPTFSILVDTCTVVSTATNNTKQRVSASLAFTIGVNTHPSKSRPGRYADLAQRSVSIVLAPSESRDISCEFSLPNHHRPNTAQVKIESSNIPNK